MLSQIVLVSFWPKIVKCHHSHSHKSQTAKPHHRTANQSAVVLKLVAPQERALKLYVRKLSMEVGCVWGISSQLIFSWLTLILSLISGGHQYYVSVFKWSDNVNFHCRLEEKPLLQTLLASLTRLWQYVSSCYLSICNGEGEVIIRSGVKPFVSFIDFRPLL